MFKEQQFIILAEENFAGSPSLDLFGLSRQSEIKCELSGLKKFSSRREDCGFFLIRGVEILNSSVDFFLGTSAWKFLQPEIFFGSRNNYTRANSCPSD